MSFALLFFIFTWVSSGEDTTPFHAHLALSSDPTRMFVSWRTNVSTSSLQVSYGTTLALSQTTTGTQWSFNDTAPSGSTTGPRMYYFYKATMNGLAPGQKYYYQVGGENGSAVLSFIATRSREQFSEETPLRVAFLGDMGYTDSQALDYLVSDAKAGSFDHYTHVGDFGYDLNYRNGWIGDLFEDTIEPITSSAPYESCEGNHEQAGWGEGGGGFAHYTNRFAVVGGDNTSQDPTPSLPQLYPMPGVNNHWYSYTVGLVHFVATSTEAYFFYPGESLQYAWLEKDLEAVNRSVTPWVVVYGHRSIYCSCDSDCDGDASVVRNGPKGDGVYGMEGLLNKYKVDLWVNGHEHNYERNYAVFNSTLATGGSQGKPGSNASSPEVLINPTAPIYIVEGCAGDVEHHEPFTRPQPVYSAFRSNTYGYARLTVFNSSTLLWEQVQTDKEYPATTGTVIDAMLVVKAPTS